MTDEFDKTMPGYRDRQADGRFEPGDLILGRYKVLSELGKGGMGIVYKCEDQTSHVCYAVKTLAPELTDSKWEMEEILYNFQLVQKLHHPNIANYNALELDPQTNRYFLVMEYVEGEDLRYWLRSKRREGADLQQVIPPVVRQIAQALDYAHSQKIVHRDIKPGNIMIDGVGNVKVLDFGLAAQIHSSLSRVSIQSVNEASTCGTIPYMAPEQWRGGEAEAASDQYALAATVYEMFSGRPPFDSADKDILRNCTLHEAPRPLKDVSPAIRSAVEKALAKEPEDRFNSCADFADAMEGGEIPEVMSAPAEKVSSGRSGGGAWKWIAAVIVLALIAGGVYFVVKQEKNEERVENERIARERAENERIARERAENERIARERAENERIARERAENERIARESEPQILEKKGELQTLKRKIRSWHLHEGDAESENQWAILEQNENNANSSAYPESKITFLDRALAAANWLIKNNKPDTCYSRGWDCSQQKNYTQAVKWYRKAAEQGYASAQCYLGWCYENGQGVEKDLAKAVEWYRKAAEQGNMYAQFNLGLCYKNGLGVEKDLAKAVEWFRKAADQGDADAQTSLGSCYYNGHGVERDYYEAVKWYRKATEQGEMYAQYNLGLCYQYGRGVDKNINEAVKWYRKAVEQGHETAKKNLQDLGY